ncbi:MAG: C10 family peptidase [Flavobacteriaceae bacterium]
MKLNYLKIVFVLTLTIILSSNSYSQELNRTAKEVTANFYNDLTGNSSEIKSYFTLNKNEIFKTYVVNYKNGGYVIAQETVSGNKIMGFSEVGEFSLEGSPLLKVIERNSFIENNFTGENTVLARNSNSISNRPTGDIDPFMTDIWGGVNCFDNNGQVVYPGNYYTPSHCSAGCVAISMSQVLHFYEWPIVGMGSNTFADNYNGTLTRHSRHFDAIEYDWTSMQDLYQGVVSTDVSRKAVGNLFYSADCALQMNFEPSGSTSNINTTPFVYQNFFRYTSNYQDVTWSSFWSRLYDNIQQGRPVPVAVDASRTGDGHVFVVNGYKEIGGEPYYYLNWGWYNDGGINAWYNIQSWTDASPGYNQITGASFDLLPNPQITDISGTGSGNDFKVTWEISAKISPDEYTLEQNINNVGWTEVASGITASEYTITNPQDEIYRFRVKAMIQGSYYANSWSESEIHAVTGDFNGYGQFGGSQYAYAYQTPDTHLDFTADYTFETWIRLKDGNVDGNVILDEEYAFGIDITNVDEQASEYDVKFTSHNSSASIISNANGFKLTPNTWHHVAITHTGTFTRLYIDGTLQAVDISSNFNLASSNSALNLGEKYRSGYQGRIKADMDQLRISTNARYTSDFTPNREEIFVVDANTVAYFTFQNFHGVRLKDEAAGLSFRVSNEANYVEWNFERTAGSLSTDDYDLLKSSINLYPNPTNNSRFKISFNENVNLENVQIHIFDLLGKQIRFNNNQRTFNQWEVSIDSNTPTGIYFVQISGDGFTASKKLIIQ